ncbi:MAG: outer membrane lipoprotein-sorting protein [Bacteroidales bacterium]|nr:outer membrane lipoprotein-sorting protein [Bacteroidales bacterium]
MNKYFISPLLLLLFFVSGITIIHAQDGADLLRKMDQVIFAPKDKQAQVKIMVSSGSKDDKIREAILMQKGADKKIYRYTKPESQAGVATLSLPGDIMWLYMPAFEKPKKISLLAKSQAFTGTDFAYEDIPVLPYSDRYNSKYLKTEGNTFLLELVPNADKSNYSKLVVAIDQKNHYPVRIDYYDKRGSKQKEATYKYIKTGNYWNAEEVTMTDLKKNSQTIIIMSDVKFDQGLPDDLFTVEKFMK